MIWDTAGQEEFDSLTASYYRGSGACAIVFSSTDRASFEAVERWKGKVEAEFEGKRMPVMCLVQNKADLLVDSNGAGAGGGGSGGGAGGSAAQMSEVEVEALARRLGLRLFRTSVKQDVNVREVFEFLAAQFIMRGQEGSAAAAAAASSSSSSSSSAVAAASSPEGKASDGKVDDGDGVVAPSRAVVSAAAVGAPQASLPASGAGASAPAPAAKLFTGEAAAAGASLPSSGSATDLSSAAAAGGTAPAKVLQLHQPVVIRESSEPTIKLGGKGDETARKRRPKNAGGWC